MIFRDSIKEQLKNSFEIIIAVALLIFGSILIFSLAADVFGSRIAEVIEDNYGPDGLFNLGIPDIVWILMGVFIISVLVKIGVSLLMPIILPFYGYCPKCGVKPLPNEERCSDCKTPLYRRRISKFDIKMFLYGTSIISIFIIIWFALSLIIGVREGVDPGI